jgi:mRNA interferase YafQ
MYKILFAKDFVKSTRRLEQSGKFKKKELDDVLLLLAGGEPLPAIYRDHALRGEYAGSRECHVRGDLLLTYEKHDAILVLVMMRIGTHHQLFGT